MYSEENWTHTDLGSPISLYASADLNSLIGKRPLLLMGGVHGDEPLGVHLAQSTLQWLREEGRSVTLPWILIPVLNVDGFKAGTRVNGRGVDLNRNYPAKGWTPEFEKERYNPGPSPASEAEIRSLVKLIDEVKPRLLIHCHSWKPMIVAAGEPGLADAERLSRSSTYKVVPEIGYPTPGSLSEFGWKDRGIPVICIEEDDDAPRDSVWPRFAPGIREIFLDASSR